MPVEDVPIILKGLTQGTAGERSVMNILPTALSDTSRNIEILRDGSFRPRRGIDFVGESDSSAYMHTIRSVGSGSETSQESPSGIYAAFKTSDGTIVEKDIIFQDNQFKIFNHNNLKNFDFPNQTIDPGARVNTTQKYYNVSMVFANNKIFFAGRKLQPGYLYLDTDNTTLNIVYLSLHTRDLDNATAASSRVQLNGKYYECVEAHTSAATDVTTNDSFGELVFNRYWMELDNTSIPGGTATWSAGNSYTTNITKASDKYQSLSNNNPHGVDFWKNRLWFITDDKTYYTTIAVDVEDAKTSTTPTGTHEYSLFLQKADPFDTNDPNPTAADGGVISLDAGINQQLQHTEDAIFIGTTTEVQEIRGATVDFTHLDFKTGRVINEGINGVDNMVVADNRLYVFANNNMWASIDEQRRSQAALTRFAKVGSKKIKSYYTSIPKLNKGTARAVYSPTKEKIYYFHNNTSLNFDNENRTITGQNGYATNIMVIDISGTTQDIDPSEEQFVENQIEIWNYEDHASSGGTYIAFAYSGAPTAPSQITVVAGTNTVVVGSDTVVISGLSGSQEGSDEIIVIAMEKEVSGGTATIRAGMAVLESTNLTDWSSDNTRETNYSCNADLGTQIFENVIAKNMVRHVVFVFEKLTDGVGSCLLRTAFDFSKPDSDGENTGKTLTQQEIYLDTKNVAGGTVSRNNYNATTYKHRVRGRGRAFQISLSNTAGKDFKLLGWGELAKLRR